MKGQKREDAIRHVLHAGRAGTLATSHKQAGAEEKGNGPRSATRYIWDNYGLYRLHPREEQTQKFPASTEEEVSGRDRNEKMGRGIDAQEDGGGGAI